MERRVAAPEGAAQAHVGGAAALLLVRAVVGDLEDAALVEVEPAALAFQTLKEEDAACTVHSIVMIKYRPSLVHLKPLIFFKKNLFLVGEESSLDFQHSRL